MNSKTFDKMKEEIIRLKQQEQDREAQEERVRALCEIVKYMDANYTLSGICNFRDKIRTGKSFDIVFK